MSKTPPEEKFLKKQGLTWACWSCLGYIPQLIGTLQGRARGLDPSEFCHFIAFTEKQVLLYQILNEDEYNFL